METATVDLGFGSYTCAACGKTYPKVVSDEEAMAEAVALHGDMLGDDPAVVCDACWRKMTGCGDA
jgi:hypothetical protein